MVIAMHSGDYALKVDSDKFEIEKNVKADIAKAFAVLDSHLNNRTFFVGERITVTDISYFAVLGSVIKYGLVDLTSYSSLLRFFLTVGNHQSIIELTSDVLSLMKAPSSGIAKAANENGSFSGKWQRTRIRVKELLAVGEAMIGQQVTVQGWVRTMRSAERNQTIFVELTDGSSAKCVQLVLNSSSTEGIDDVAGCGGVGASLSVVGIVVASPAKGQTIEVHASKATVLGAVYGGDGGTIGGKNYPMSKKQHGLEFLREMAHLRPRSKVFSSAMRMRHAMAFATHKFFNDRGFVYVHTPLITAADCEGAGEQFTVTTLLPEEVKVKDIPVDKNGHVDFSKDFFARRCCMTVSGQLNVETHACALSDVYTFGPTFRAENSHTARHLAEFWMIEPEICFAELVDDMALAVR